MREVRPIEGRVRLMALLLVAAAFSSGCALLDELRPAKPVEPVLEPRLPPRPIDTSEPVQEPPEPTPPPPAVVAPEPEPEPEPVPVEEPVRIAVLLSSRSADYERVATSLRAQVDDLDVFDLSDKSLTQREIFESMQRMGTEVVVAIGFRATALAAASDSLPVVFAQVFNTGGLDLESGRIRGVSVLPPLDKQIEAWRQLNPNLSSVGMIVGAGHEDLIEEGRRAAEAASVRFHYSLAQSDRETLYQFTRLVPDIDGFWLIPDNRVLSASVLRQMLGLASRHQVQVAAFNDSLLSIGATLSTTTVDTDVAATIIQVATELAAGEGEALPDISPLSEVSLKTAVPPVPDGATVGGSR